MPRCIQCKQEYYTDNEESNICHCCVAAPLQQYQFGSTERMCVDYDAEFKRRCKYLDNPHLVDSRIGAYMIRVGKPQTSYQIARGAWLPIDLVWKSLNELRNLTYKYTSKGWELL
jgi:hypothetical protein